MKINKQINILLIISLIIMFISPLFARAGRGGSYRSSSSSSSRSSYSSSSSSSYSHSSSYGSGSSSSSSSSSSSGSYSSHYKYYTHIYKVDNYEANLYLQKDGSLIVKENYTIDMGTYLKKKNGKVIKNSSSGISIQPDNNKWNFRFVKNSVKVTGDMKLERVLYYSKNKINLSFKKKSKLQLKHKFQVEYKISNAIFPIPQYPALYFSPNLTNGIDKIKVTLHLIKGVKVYKKAAYKMVFFTKILETLKIKKKSTTKYQFILKKPLKGTNNFLVAFMFTEKSFNKLQIRKKSFPKYFLYDNINYNIKVHSNKMLEQEIQANFTAGKYRKRYARMDLLYHPRHLSIKANCPSSNYIFYSSFEENSRTKIWNDYALYLNKNLKDFSKNSYKVKFKSFGNFCSINKKNKTNKLGESSIYFTTRIPILENSYSIVDKVNIKIDFDEDVLKGIDKKNIKTSIDVITPAYYHSYKKQKVRTAKIKTKWSHNTLNITYDKQLLTGQTLYLLVHAPAKNFSKTFEYFTNYKMLVMQQFSFFGSEKQWWQISQPWLILFFLWILYRIIKSSLKKKFAGQKLEKLAQENTQNVTSEISKYDNNFSKENFLEKAEDIFMKLQKAWSTNNMQSVRSFVSQGIYHRLNLQLKLMIEEEGLRNIMSDYKILDKELSGIHTHENYLTIHMKYNAKAKDITIPFEYTEKEIQDDLNDASYIQFTEVYSFTRKKNIQTNENKSIYNGQCPSCGSVAENLTDANKCESCGAIFNSGEYDWVLSEITQIEEWKSPWLETYPPLKSKVSTAVTMNKEIIEDRASYLFWQYIYANAKGKADVLNRDTTSNFLSNFSPSNKYYSEPVVGAADLIDFTETEENILANIKITWSAAFDKHSVPQNYQTTIQLSLDKNIKNNYGFADHGCPACGGPTPDNDEVKCQFCGEELPTKTNDWLLNKVE